MGVLELLAPDEATVLWDFDDPTGAANYSGVKTSLAAQVDLGTIEPQLNIFRTGAPGGMALSREQPPVEFGFGFMASATTYDALAAGLGQLARWLANPPGPLRWTEGTATRYVDLLGTLNLPTLLRGQGTAGIVPLRARSLGPIPVRLLRQPWLRAAEITTSSVTVPNDPATGTKVRVFPVTVSGDLEVPARVRVQMDTGSAVERVLIANRALGAQASAIFADYLSDTGYANLDATGRGWTVTLSGDTTSVADANASGGNMARCAYTSNPTVMAKRSRLTRTTKMDSLRGTWDVWARVKASAAAHGVQLRWGPSTAETPAFSNLEVIHDTGLAGSSGYVELNLGTLYLQEDATLSGLAVEIWTRRISGTGNLDMDFIWFSPKDRSGTVVVSGGGAGAVDGSELVTPTNPAGFTAGTVSGTHLVLDATGEGGGTAPVAGTQLEAGRWEVTFGWEQTSGGVALFVRNITDSTTTTSVSMPATPTGARSYTLRFDAVAGKAYQFQVQATGSPTSSRVTSISWQFLASLAANESLRTEPGDRYTVDRLNNSGNLTSYLGVEGELPAMLQPGENHLMIRALEIPLQFYEENESKLGRTPTVTVSYAPRYAL